MRFTLGWLKDHLETDALLEDITEQLTALGLEVENVEDRAKIFEPFRVAYVEKAEKHPNADRLKVCTVDTGKEKIQVVCGAPNARTGMKGVFAPVGSYIPGSDMTLRKGVIRDVESHGMLVSEREMGISGEHEGIIEVPEDTAVGMPFAALYGLDDPVIEIALTPNRPDCAGVRGIARDLAAAGMGRLKPLDEAAVQGVFESPLKVHLDFDTDTNTASACPLFLGRYIRNVKNAPSPDWLQKRLRAIGLRPISALVDITNYVSYDLCRPLHVFDADKLQGDLHVRLARKGETLAALNDKTYELDDFMTVVTDEESVLALGGVIGGGESGCTAETTNVYLEVAYFDPDRTARTGRALQVASDARYRFERGIDPLFTIPATEIATRLILELCGGEASETVKAGDVPEWKRTISHDPSYVGQIAGFDVPEGRQARILEDLGFTLERDTVPWQVTPPSWRPDIGGQPDLVEEIVRVEGYDAIPPVSMRKAGALTRPAETPARTVARKARNVLADRGLNETVTYSFLSHELADAFGANDNQAAAALRLANPISIEMDQMRPSILPNLLEAARRNADKGFPDTALFEVGPVFVSARMAGQLLVAGGLRNGTAGPRHWSGKEASRAVDVFDARADALAVLAACGVPSGNLQVSRDAPVWFHPGRSGVLRLGPNILAHFGEIHPALLAERNATGPMAGFEVFLERIPQARKKAGPARSLLTLSPFQPVSRDFAFIVDEGVEAESLARAAAGADKKLIERVEIFDIYSGKGIEDGKKSIALNVVIQPADQTLTEAELERLSDRVVESVSGRTGARLRG